jgi:hypothetical protein
MLITQTSNTHHPHNGFNRSPPASAFDGNPKAFSLAESIVVKCFLPGNAPTDLKYCRTNAIIHVAFIDVENRTVLTLRVIP